MTGVINTSYSGFALDSNGSLYIGESRNISLYENDRFEKSVYTTPRGFRFTIKDDRLYVATEGAIEILDLSGNLIEKHEDFGSIEIARLNRQRNVFITDEAKYIASNIFGFYKITKHNNDSSVSIVYQTKLFDWICDVIISVIPLIAGIVFMREYIIWLRYKKKNCGLI